MRAQCKRRLRTIITSTFLMLCTQASALLPPCDVPVCWEGFYISGQLGMGQDKEHSKFVNPNYFNTLGPDVLGSNFTRTAKGFIGGGALGVNFQSGAFVMGIEGGALSTNFKTSRPSPFFPDTDVFSSHLDYLANGKGRIGYATESLLTFVSGGWAGGHHVLKLDDTSSDEVANLKSWLQGWTVGAGFDCKFAERLSLGIAYDYYQLHYRKKTASCPNCGEGIGLGTPQIDNTFNIQTLTFRLNYFFL